MQISWKIFVEEIFETKHREKAIDNKRWDPLWSWTSSEKFHRRGSSSAYEKRKKREGGVEGDGWKR